MLNLFLVRHAKSSWDHSGLRDHDRPLNKRGERDAPTMARMLKGMGIRPDLLVSSTATRARTTARYFAEELGIPENDIVEKGDIYEAYPTAILKVISELPNDAHTVFLFGHNPTFTDVANRFTDNYIDNVPTCGVVHIRSSAPSWAEFYEENAKVKACYFPKDVL